MWTNRISKTGQTSRQRRFSTPPAAGVSRSPLVPAGAFVVPPSAGFQADVYEIARCQAVFELTQRRRMHYVGLN